MAPNKKYLSLEEAAMELGIKPDALVRLREKGQVRGFADRQLRDPAEPFAASDRRISVIVRYQPDAAGSGNAPADPGTKPEEAGAK